MSDPHPNCTYLHILQAKADEIGARAIIAEVPKLIGGEGHANARLIAVAPEMADWIREAVNELSEWLETFPEGSDSSADVVTAGERLLARIEEHDHDGEAA